MTSTSPVSVTKAVPAAVPRPAASPGGPRYAAPLRDMQFLLRHFGNLGALTAAGVVGADMETADAVFNEMARFCEQKIVPLNRASDLQPARLIDGTVQVTIGFVEAYRAYCAAGWQSLPHPGAFGGQGLPRVFSALCQEILNSASVSFALCPLLTNGAIDALTIAGTPEQQALYLPRLISGEWSGTMNLTEPQAGSDLSLVQSQAFPNGEGAFAVSGTKIFITYGEHEMSENIVHLVLARLPDAQEGVKGLSLFLVPKFLPHAGNHPSRNAVECLSLEHKLGIHGSPTAVLRFDAAVGWLIGKPGQGLEIMFVMMNAARFSVGVQGLGIAERALQAALAYARERRQSRDPDPARAAEGAAPIIRQPDVRRMLAGMRARIEGGRALVVYTASLADRAESLADSAARLRYEYLVPIVKGWLTEQSVLITSEAVQIHGGAGYIEETGVAQYLRDARILPIYEGTTAIQANDLAGRKTRRDEGLAGFALVDDMAASATDLHAAGEPVLVRIGDILAEASTAFRQVVAAFAKAPADVRDAQIRAAASVPYLMLAGVLASGWLLARSAHLAHSERVAPDADRAWLSSKILTAHLFAETWLSGVPDEASRLFKIAAAVTDFDLQDW